MTRVTTLCKKDVAILKKWEKKLVYKLKLIVVGKVKEEYYRKKIAEFSKTIEKKINFQIIELEDESIPKKASDSIMSQVKEKEGNRILENIDNQDYVVALCIDGKITTKEGLKNIFQNVANQSIECVDFIIGGSLGLSDKVVRRANYKLSFSKMTFPHQLMRVMLLEQIMDSI